MAASGNALVGPEEAGDGDQGGGRDDDPAAVLFLVLDPEGGGDSEADDGELAEFDPEVEAEEGTDDGAGGDAFVDEALGEAEAVDQAEDEDQEDAELTVGRAEDVFQGDEEDTVIGPEFLFIKKKDTLKKVGVSEIVHIEVEERYCTIFTENDKFVIQISLSKIQEQLDAAKFFRTHRNHIVNIDRIVEIQPADNLLALTNGQLIPISDNYKDVLQKFRFLK